MPDPILPGRPGLYLSMLQYGLLHYREFAAEHVEFYRQLRRRVGDVRGLRVLDVGCGKSYWLSLLLASDGAIVSGVDTEEVMPGRSLGKYRRIWSANGIERALRTATWDVLFARPYLRALEREFGQPLRDDLVEVMRYDGVNLPFPDRSFDLVVSHEVFEHVSDMGALLDSLVRVMKPQARTYIYVHSWTAISGGHHIAWKHPNSKPSRVVAPWDHLRAGRHQHVPSWLNRLRADDYRRLFAERFDIEDWVDGSEEGRALLTREIQAELRDYSPHELLTKGFTIIARPRLRTGQGTTTA